MKQHFADLATDTKYLREIANGVAAHEIRTDINLGLLTDTLDDFGMEDLYPLVNRDGIDPQVKLLVADLVHRVASPTPEAKAKLIALWDHLAEDDGHDPEPADCIFVFGGPETTKARKAAELFRANKAPCILFTGDTQRALIDQPHISESERDKKIAMALGVPEEAILVEKKSFNTPGNVENALEILKGVTPFPTSFILVNLPWYLRRATNTFITFWSKAPVAAKRIHRINAGSERFSAQNYFLDKDGLEYVVYEYLKMKQARDMAHM